MTLTVPPHSAEAEKAVLGCMMIEQKAADLALTQLTEESFYVEGHRMIFRAIAELDSKRESVDVVTVFGRLATVENAPGGEFLTELVSAVPTAAHIEDYCKIVKDKEVMRFIIDGCITTIQDCRANEKDVDELIAQAEKLIYGAARKTVRDSLVPASVVAHEAIVEMDGIASRKQDTVGLSTGFRNLDRLISGLRPGSVNVIAARPSMGKTSLALDFTRHAVLVRKTPAAFFSLEMTNRDIMMRLIAATGAATLWALQHARLDSKGWAEVNEAAGLLAESPLHFSTGAASPSSIRSGCTRLATKLLLRGQKLGLVVVDYIQLLTNPASRRKENEQAELAEISRSLKLLALELDVPVIAISQLNRQPEGDGRGGRPRLSDLRGSGTIEQDADVVAFVYREGFYKAGATREDKAQTKLIIGKNRNGPTGEIDMWFDGDHTRFIELAKTEEDK